MRPLTLGIAAITAILSVGETTLGQPYPAVIEPAGMPTEGYQTPPVWGGSWQDWGTVPGASTGPQGPIGGSYPMVPTTNAWNEQALPLLPISLAPWEGRFESVDEFPLTSDFYPSAQGCRLIFDVGTIALQRSNVAFQPLVFDSASSVTVLSTEDLQFDFEAGLLLSLRFALSNRGQLEVIYFRLNDWTRIASITSPNNLIVPGTLGSLAPDFSLADRIQIDYSSEIDSGELNYRHLFWPVDLLIGLRTLHLREDLVMRAEDFVGPSLSRYMVHSQNRLYGTQIGVVFERTFGPIDFETFGKAGVYVNSASQRTSLTAGIGSELLPNFSRSAKHVSFIGQVGLGGSIPLLPWLRLHGGYDIMWVEDVALAPAQLDFTTTTTSIPQLNDQAGVILYGAHAALEYRWGDRPLYTHHPPWKVFDFFLGEVPRSSVRVDVGVNFLRRPGNSMQDLVIDDSTKEVLLSTGDAFGSATGLRATLLTRLCDRGQLEGTYFGKNRWSQSASVESSNNLNLPGELGKTTIAFDYNRSDIITMNRISELESAELNYRHFFFPVDLLVGVRYLDIWEKFGIQTFDVDAGIGTGISNYDIMATNKLYGGQIGIVYEQEYGLLGLQTFGKLGVYNNDSRQRTFLGDISNQSILVNTDVGGKHVAMVGQIGLQGVVELQQWLLLRGGYEALWLEDVALAKGQLDFDNPVVSGSKLSDEGRMFFHGFAVSLEVRWGGNYRNAFEWFDSFIATM